RQEESLAEDRFQSALANLEASRLATLQTETDVRQSYSVFDPPVIPVEPNGSLLDDVILVAGFGLLGMLLALAGPVIGAALNRTLVFSDDLDLGDRRQSVIAVLPKVKKNETRLEGIVVPDGDSAPGSPEDIGQRTITFVPPPESGDGTDPDSADALIEELVDGSPSTGSVKTVTPPAPPPAQAQPPAAPAEPAVAEAPAAPAEPAAAEAPAAEPAEPAAAQNEPADDGLISEGVTVVAAEPAAPAEPPKAPVSNGNAGPPPAPNTEAPPAPAPAQATADGDLSQEMQSLLETTELADHLLLEDLAPPLPGPPERPNVPPPADRGADQGKGRRG
ncbi:MAG: hypothetical protein AAFO29_23740, partial [Actinomycetota bacterium]